MGWKSVGALVGGGTIATQLTPVLPTYSTGDLLVIVAYGQGSSTATCTSTGYVEKAFNDQGTGGNRRQVTVLTKVAGASESNPVVNWSVAPGTNITAVVFVLDDIHADQEDVAEQDGGSGDTAALEHTPTGLTTVTNDATVVSIAVTTDDNTIGLKAGSEQSFTGRLTGTNANAPAGRAASLGIASRLVASSGAVTMPTWEQTINFNDAWASISMAFKPAAGTVNLAGTPQGVATVTATLIKRMTATVAGLSTVTGTLTVGKSFAGAGAGAGVVAANLTTLVLLEARTVYFAG